MSELTITIDLDNAAFHDGYIGTEVARILRAHADTVELDQITECTLFTLRDSNGNAVGTALYELVNRFEHAERLEIERRTNEAREFVKTLTATQVIQCLENLCMTECFPGERQGVQAEALVSHIVDGTTSAAEITLAFSP